MVGCAGRDLPILPKDYSWIPGMDRTFTPMTFPTSPTLLSWLCAYALLTLGAMQTVLGQSLPVVPLAEVPDLVAKGKQARVQGIVTFQIIRGFVFIQDSSGALCLHRRDNGTLAVGDLVEATVHSFSRRGYWHVAETAQKIGTRPVPAPELVRGDEFTVARHHAARIVVTGRVISHSQSTHDYFIDGAYVPVRYDVLTTECDGANLRMAFLKGTDITTQCPVGTRATFTGMARVHDLHDDSTNPYVAIWVDGPGAVEILELPSILARPQIQRWLTITGLIVLGGIFISGVWMLAQRRRMKLLRAKEEALRQSNAELERRVAERTQELHQALARERELGEMKSNFVTLVSHEFRTPLGVIMSAVEVLQRYFERLPVEKRARHLDMIFRSTKNLAQLIDEVLLLGCVEEGRMKFAPVPVDVEKICRTLSDELHSATGGTSPIHFSVETNLDGAVSDVALLRHIITNLLSNAVKYSERGSPVEFCAGRKDRYLVLTIRDQGIGIPGADQERLFTSFTRASNAGQRPGTGLGLVIVNRCVQLHGGKLHLESATGRGTHITVTLPSYPAA